MIQKKYVLRNCIILFTIDSFEAVAKSEQTHRNICKKFLFAKFCPQRKDRYS